MHEKYPPNNGQRHPGMTLRSSERSKPQSTNQNAEKEGSQIQDLAEFGRLGEISQGGCFALKLNSNFIKSITNQYF
jgi:hypothetical protein